MLLTDSFLLQIIILYLLFNFFFLDHAFYYLSFFFFFLMWLGLSMCFLEIDTFAAVLWIVEMSVIIVFFLFSLFINNMYSAKKYSIKLRLFFFSFLIPIFFLSLITFFTPYVGYENLNKFFNINWINYYLINNNNLDNDFSLLFLLFLNLNSFEFLFISNLISLGCIIAVVLYIYLKDVKIQIDNLSLKSFKLINKNYKFSYIRHQCFYKQQYAIPSIRICKKKF